MTIASIFALEHTAYRRGIHGCAIRLAPRTESPKLINEMRGRIGPRSGANQKFRHCRRTNPESGTDRPAPDSGMTVSGGSGEEHPRGFQTGAQRGLEDFE